MAKPFDAVMKELLDAYAADWVVGLASQLGLPADVALEPIDGDLATVQRSADKVFRLKEPERGLVHLEVQSNRDGDLPGRLLTYHALLHERHGGPITSVAVLLRPSADSSKLDGILTRDDRDGTEYLRFHYRVLRVWELSGESLLRGPLGLLPLAVLTTDAKEKLPEYVTRMRLRFEETNTAKETRDLLFSCCYLLCGLLYNEDAVVNGFTGVTFMLESSTYQGILRDGRKEGMELGRKEGMELGRREGKELGRQEGRQEAALFTKRLVLLDLLRSRFGSVPPELEARVQTQCDLDLLQTAILSTIRIASPDELVV